MWKHWRNSLRTKLFKLIRLWREINLRLTSMNHPRRNNFMSEEWIIRKDTHHGERD
jgi:hypothetical protein